MKRPPRIALALGLVAAAAAAVVAALLTVGGPATGRLGRLDERRVSDLFELVRTIERHRVVTGRLPGSLEDLPQDVVEGQGTPTGRPHLRDPQTGKPYGYDVLEEGRFRVCTRLSLPDAPAPLPEPAGVSGARFTKKLVPGAESHHLCLGPVVRPG